MDKQPIIMISSTARDLPEYRKQVMDACLRASMLPKMMEQLPALDADAIEASLALVRPSLSCPHSFRRDVRLCRQQSKANT